MAISAFEFFDAAGVRRSLKCDITGGVVTFLSQVDLPPGNVFSVDWNTNKPVNLRNGTNEFNIDSTGAGLVRVSNLVSVGFQSAQQVQFPSPQRVLTNQNFFPSRILTPANNASVVRNAPARLQSFYVENLNTTANRFLIFFNQTGLPTANQSTNIYCAFNIPANQVVSIGSDFFSQEGINFPSGIVAAFSTLRSQYTNPGSNDMDLTVVSALN